MDYEEFKRAWSNGQIEVSVDRAKALRIASSSILPKRYRFAHWFWATVWLLSMPIGIAVIFLYKWWVGLLILVFVTPAIGSGTKTSAMQFMIDHAIEESSFYKYALENNVFIISTKAS